MRIDLDAIMPWIKPGSRVLDLACGDGELLERLATTRDVHGYGLEIGEREIKACLQRQVNVIEQDLNQGLSNFADHSFDAVIMTQALQVMDRPDLLLEDMLRVGRQCVVTFPNFGHWQARMHLALRGRMPVSEFLPYQWYDTPNIHFCTVKDFEVLCRERGISILDRKLVGLRWIDQHLKELFPNWFGETAVYHLSR